MRTTVISSVPYKFLAALAIIAMLLAALPAMPAYAASIVVNTTTDENTNNGNCSLREAIIAANNNAAHNGCSAGSGADTITLTSGSTYTLSLVGTTTSLGDLDITDPAGLTIQASGTTPAIIDGGDIDRVLDIPAGAGNLTLTYITVQNGNTTAQATTTGGGISFSSTAILTLTNSNILDNIATNIAGCGAGIHNNSAATINITNSTIAGNICAEAGSDGGGLFKGGAGGVLNIDNSTFSGNSANDNGGAIHLGDGTATIRNSTFTGNVSSNRGGAIQIGSATATATIEFSTFSANAANNITGNAGGDIQVSAGSAAINRSILANPVAGMSCDQSVGASVVFTDSLVENNNDCTGTFITSDPGLFALANNGGPTQTMAINRNGPALNAADTCNSVATDQRGIARPQPQGGSCDLGAYEAVLPTVVSIVRASPNPINAATVNYTVTFSEAVSNVGAADFALTVDGVEGANVSGVTGSGTTYTVTVTTGTGNGTLRLDIPVGSTTINATVDLYPLSGLPFEGEVYNRISSAPVAATLTSPTGAIATNNPTYTWNKVFDATWYYIYIQGPSGLVHADWYSSATVCGASTCSLPSVTTLATGEHRWWVQTWNSVGYGPWSAGLTFTVPAPTPPAAATLVSPNGNITTSNPTYTWNKVSAATWYYIYIQGPSGLVHADWYSSAAVCGATTCSLANAPTLAAGEHKWWIQTWNGTGGYGPWSTGMTFTVVAPAAATLNTPNGVTSNNPTYNWNKVSAATWYNLYVSGPSGYVFSEWYRASDVCGASTCSVVGATNGLASGQYRWWIQTWNNVGYGPWSTGLNFSVP